ncbi:chorion class CB protein M5H4-like [Leguminivora glycinivorella]|uniref:chorion class CB protein M5H4-like n=1 Tax=Leguminivora glycinivorella TaxID=1035111 RepID=UPI00200F0DD5|nr:chorion class CB protein M5H4-like [Leguminivora glycinivorella]
MAYKYITFCAAVYFIQYVVGQSIYTPNCECRSIILSETGGPLAITSLGPITPSGIAVATDLGLAGELELSGALPYLSAVAFEGTFDTNGTAPVAYGCGDAVAITQELGNPSAATAAPGYTSTPINTCARRS